MYLLNLIKRLLSKHTEREFMGIIKIENTQHWHDLRSKHIGASEIAGLFGCSPWHTPHQLFLDKADMVHHPISGQLADFGRLMEPIVAAMLAAESGWKIEKSYQYAEHPDYPYLGATLDYYVLESEHGRGILEIKYVNQFAPDWTQTKAPDHIELQVQHQLFVVNAARVRKGLKPFDWIAIGSMHGGNPEDVRIMLRAPDKAMQAKIVERASKFWAQLQAGITPETLEPKDYEYVSEIFKQASRLEKAQVKDLSQYKDADTLCEQYIDLGEQIKALEKQRAKVKTEIMHGLLHVQGDKLEAHVAGETEKFEVAVELSEVNHKPKAAHVSTSVRFNLKPKRKQ